MMPAYNYFPATYQSPYYPQPMLQQPIVQQPPQQPAQPPVQQQIQNGIIWVSGDAEANAFPIAPNNAVRLWHSSLPIVYFKSADASGKPTLKAYDLVERTESAAAPENEVAYATKAELNILADALDSIRDDMKSFRKEIDKKKRKEVDDDE